MIFLSMTLLRTHGPRKPHFRVSQGHRRFHLCIMIRRIWLLATSVEALLTIFGVLIRTWLTRLNGVNSEIFRILLQRALTTGIPPLNGLTGLGSCSSIQNQMEAGIGLILL